MAITGIKRLKGCGVFRDFTWPDELLGFARYNLIYGWNWSGKTTISNVFHAVEARTCPITGQVTLSLDGQDVHGDQFAQVNLPVRVFNREFIAESVFPVGGGDMPPIFVLGKESVKRQKEIKQRKSVLTTAQAKSESEEQIKLDAETAVDKFCIDRAKVIKDTLRSSGSNPYNDYDKSNFKRRAQQMVADGDAATHHLSQAEREKLLAQHRATQKPKVQMLAYRLPALNPLAGAASELLSATVVSAVIQSLKDDPDLSSWTHQGLGLHQDRRAEKCLFCRQTLPRDRLATLEAHFSAEYEQFMKRLEAQITQLRSMSEAAAGVVLPNRAECYEDLAEEYGVAEASLREALSTLRCFLDSLAQALTDKRDRVFECLSLNLPVPKIDAAVVDRLNKVIQKHNQGCDEFQARVSAARKRLEADFVACDLEEFVRLESAVQTSVDSAAEAAAEVERLGEEIERLEREIVEHRRPAEELNEDLHKYLGHDELCLAIKDTGYTITRNRIAAQALSEGEMTAIALLYFLKSLEDREFDLRNGVVVLDDPVSSLDANALYFAFGFIRERTQHAAQLIILTHNFTFFRLVRNWFHHLPDQHKKDVNQRPARFYMLDHIYDQDKRCARIRWLDPLLEQYESEYHYLFARVYRAATATTQRSLEESYVFPNIARRLLEAFLAFRQPQVSGELWKKVEAVPFDEAKKLRILRFLHTYSHGDTIAEPDHDLSLLGEANAVLEDLLELIKGQDREHYEGMIKLVGPPVEEGDDG